MKITKKTRLLAALKHIVLTSIDAPRPGNSIYVKGENFEGASGYYADASIAHFDATVEIGGVRKSIEFINSPDASPDIPWLGTWPSDLPESEKITVTVTPNPVKTDFDQTPVSITED